MRAALAASRHRLGPVRRNAGNADVAMSRNEVLTTRTYVIGSACVDVMDKSCVQECPADCIYEGARSLYINPDECVDCGACKIACRLDAIEYETDLSDDQERHLASG